MNLAQPWEIADLVDFEYILERGSGVSDEGRFRQACEFFQTKTLPALQDAGTTDRQVVFRSWLEAYRAVGIEPLPGKYVASAGQALILFSILLGVGLGGSLTAALLLYHGEVPVNVPWFLACTLGVQMLMLLAALVLWAMRATTGFLDDFRPLRSLLVLLATWLSSVLLKPEGKDRERLRALFAKVERRREIYGSLATWPFVVINQILGVCFNLGIIVVLLAQVTFKDIEFGWQSTFVQSDETAYRIAAGMAVPWKWFAPNPHPTLREVTDSHFEYKKRHSNKSWWPFLCYSIACYGLFLRGVLLVFACLKLRAAMRGLKFDHEGCRSLYRRLVGPLVHAESGTAKLEIPPEETSTRHRSISGNSFVLVAAELDISEDRLASYVLGNFGWRLAAKYSAEVDHPSGNPGALSALFNKARSLESVIVVIPAKRPPIKAIAIFLRKVADAAGVKPEVLLLLVGRKEAVGFAQVDQEELTYWKNFLAINRLHVSLETWSCE